MELWFVGADLAADANERKEYPHAVTRRRPCCGTMASGTTIGSPVDDLRMYADPALPRARPW